MPSNKIKGEDAITAYIEMSNGLMTTALSELVHVSSEGECRINQEQLASVLERFGVGLRQSLNLTFDSGEEVEGFCAFLVGYRAEVELMGDLNKKYMQDLLEDEALMEGLIEEV